jgi:alpha-glucan,water dikinase
MHHNYERRTVLLCEKVNGEEEVPNNVQAIIITNATDYPDVLAHVSVRARNLKVMFAVLFDEAKVNQLLAMNGKYLALNVEGHHIKYVE